MHLWGPNPAPNLLQRGIQQCQDGLSGLTGDRCVYVHVDSRAAPHMLQTSFDFAYKMTEKVLYFSAQYTVRVCLCVS